MINSGAKEDRKSPKGIQEIEQVLFQYGEMVAVGATNGVCQHLLGSKLLSSGTQLRLCKGQLLRVRQLGEAVYVARVPPTFLLQGCGSRNVVHRSVVVHGPGLHVAAA